MAVRPARAGMSPKPMSCACASIGPPRPRGDEPRWADSGALPVASAPPARG